MVKERYNNLQSELRELRHEHNDLNEVIDNPEYDNKFSQFTRQKLKKRKLWVKDRILFIESLLAPNDIA